MKFPYVHRWVILNHEFKIILIKTESNFVIMKKTDFLNSSSSFGKNGECCLKRFEFVLKLQCLKYLQHKSLFVWTSTHEIVHLKMDILEFCKNYVKIFISKQNHKQHF